MAETHFELGMDEFVKNNLTWRTWIQFKDRDGTWKTNQYDIKEALDYRVGFKVTNVGTETYAKNVQIRVVNLYEKRVTFFSDDSYKKSVPRSDHTFPNTLNQDASTPWFWVHFRLGAGPDEHAARIAKVGIYADIIPRGHYWTNFVGALD